MPAGWWTGDVLSGWRIRVGASGGGAQSLVFKATWIFQGRLNMAIKTIAADNAKIARNVEERNALTSSRM